MVAFTRPDCCAQASNVLVHANYSSRTNLNDVALLYFATPFNFTSDVSTLLLPAQGTAFAGGLTCTVSGWEIPALVRGRRLRTVALDDHSCVHFSYDCSPSALPLKYTCEH